MTRKWVDRIFIEGNDFMPLREKIKMHKVSSMEKFFANAEGVNNFKVTYNEERLDENEIHKMLNTYVRENLTYFYNGKPEDYEEVKRKIEENTMKLTIIYEEVD